MVVAGLSISLSLVKVDDWGILEVLRHLPLVPNELKQMAEFSD